MAPLARCVKQISFYVRRYGPAAAAEHAGCRPALRGECPSTRGHAVWASERGSGARSGNVPMRRFKPRRPGESGFGRTCVSRIGMPNRCCAYIACTLNLTMGRQGFDRPLSDEAEVARAWVPAASRAGRQSLCTAAMFAANRAGHAHALSSLARSGVPQGAARTRRAAARLHGRGREGVGAPAPCRAMGDDDISVAYRLPMRHLCRILWASTERCRDLP